MKMLFLRTLLLFIAVMLFTVSSNLFAKDDAVEKVSKVGEYSGYQEKDYKGFKYNSTYLKVEDSVQLAMDIFLPKKRDKDEKVPTILYQTRYVRSLRAKFPFFLLKHPILAVVPEDEVKFFTSKGYAVVIVDVRGSGASTGERTMEFSPEEVKDGEKVVDWIISQEWSDGNVGTTGVSYVGTTAELLLVNQHPAVKACIPRSNIFDLYNHVMFPGGVRQGPFIKIWGFTTKSLDGNNLSVFGKQAKRLVKGINPVKGERKTLKRALEQHEGNFDVYDGLELVDYRDEVHPQLDRTPDEFSIHNYVAEIEASGTPIYRIGGWYDGALSKSVVDGYRNTKNTEKVLLGPWDHGPGNNASPFNDNPIIQFPLLEEMLRFFDFHLKGIKNGIDTEPAFYYYTVGEEQWKSTDTWPLEDQVEMKYFLSADSTLSSEKEALKQGEIMHKLDYSHNTGNSSKWNSVTALYKNGPTRYVEREKESKKLLNFDSPVLEENTEMTGHPYIDLYIRVDAEDAAVFCYIEDVHPDGSVYLVTEGQFRAMHRAIKKDSTMFDYDVVGTYHSYNLDDAEMLEEKEAVRLQFDFLPISYEFKAGHKIRLSIGGADWEHFDPIPDAPTYFEFP
ncbi:MAG: CocE/NonD family hydrolase, partial [Chitinophagales bacterium]